MLGLGEPIRELPGEWRGELPAGARDPRVFCRGALVIGGPSYAEDAEFAARLARDERVAGWPLVVLCDRPAQAAAAPINFLWTAFTRFEPAADLHGRDLALRRRHASFEPPIVLDARMKPWYPAEVFCAPEIASRVEARWGEYFPEGGVEMGDSDLAHLAPDAPTN
jgi:hypothetical protein